MPTYVYGCDACGHRFEQSQKFSDDPVRICPQCQSSVRRIFQPAGIVFKGSGWHVTDYKRNGTGGESSNGGDGSASKSDNAKPETKAAEKPAEVAASTTSEAAKPAKAAS